MFWERVLKSVFVGPETLQLGIYDAVTHFNIRCQASVKILEEIGISPGHYSVSWSSLSSKGQL